MAEQPGPRYYIVRWMLGGAAFGVAFPLIAWWVASSQLGTLTFSELHQSQPVMWVVDLAPTVVGLAGLAIGVLHQRLVAARTATEEVARQIAASWTADLHRANEELAQTLQDREKFYASVSHEFRTPLSAIIGYSSLTEEVAVAPPELGGYLSEIYSSAAALLELVNDLLDASKLDGNGIQMEISDVAANEVVSDVARLLRPLALQKGLDFVIDLQAESPSRADPIRLRQILNNLVANAIKYSERGPIVLRTYTDADRRVIVEVEDNGVGISDEDLETIFLPFAQAAAGQRTRDATGLGLSICRTFADAMGADISVRSGGPGHGSVFRLSLEAGNGRAESAMASFSTTA